VMRELGEAGAVYQDQHFVYVSGKHGPGYINADKIFPDLYRLRLFCQQLGRPFRDEDVSVVVGAATGGIPLAVITALGLSPNYSGNGPLALWADKTSEGGFAFERAGFAERLYRERVLVVEDLLTTGGSVAKVCREVEKCGGNVVGVSAICNRGGVTAEQLGIPRLESLAQVNFEAMPEADCQLCKRGVPIVEDIGHGGEYKLAHPDYAGGYVKLLG
jgi:orotate phosphoribosyltransferase